MLSISPSILEVLHWQVGITVGLAIDHGRLVIKPTLRQRYSLVELLAQCGASAETSEEDSVWLDSKPIFE